MFVVLFRDANGDTNFKSFDIEDEAVGFAVRKKGVVFKSIYPVTEEKK